jgi:glycosyltransferase involved in cell wall biosynthesis
VDNLAAEKGKVSIVIPCYNHGLYLPETLQSVEKVRDRRIAEVIVVNDGSTDETTCKIIQDLDASKFKVVHQPNQGLSSARNTGIAIAKGEFILPLDSDNLIRRAYFDQGVRLLIDNPDLGVIHGDAEYFGDSSGRWKVTEFDWRAFVIRNSIDACALFRKCVWEEAGGYDEKMRLGWEDWEFWMRVAMRGWSFFHLDEIAFDYRVRQDSMVKETVQYGSEIVEYIFNKPEYTILKALRDRAMEVERLLHFETSWDYKVGSSIVMPFRIIRRRLLR